MHDPVMSARRVAFGPFELDLRSGELRKGPVRLRVGVQSTEILKALLEQPGELVTRDQLRERLWPSDTFVDFEHGLNAAIRRLREALGDSADSPKYIETLPRRGYRFVASLERPSAIVPVADTPPHPEPSDDRNGWRRSLGQRNLVVVTALVLAVGFGAYIARRTQESPPTESAVSLVSIPITRLQGFEVEPSLSPEGNQVAFAWDGEAGENFDIYVKQLDAEGRPVPITTNAADDRFPAWAPDGKQIAFLRVTRAGVFDAFVIPALGGPERPLKGLTGIRGYRGVSWTPDSKALVFADRSPVSTNLAVFVYSLETGERQQWTHPAGRANDEAPVVSPDGRYLAFIRWTRITVMGNVFVQRLDDRSQPVGDPEQLTSDDRADNLAWAPDGRSIVYGIGGQGILGGNQTGLWRVPITGGPPRAVLPNVRATRPSVARNGRLVYQNTTTDRNIWRIPGPEQHHVTESQSAPAQLIASTAFDMSPQFSPDGGKIAFVSTRSGNYEIWTCRSDGLQMMPLTSFGGDFIGSPRWSPQGDRIAFDSNKSGTANIYAVGAEGGAIRQITGDASRNNRPSFSHDGQWIYYSSFERSGDQQIWKVAVADGESRQVTKKGAIEAFEATDGYLYYAKLGIPGIWRVQINGGEEVQIIDHGIEGSWSVIDGGIVLMNKQTKPQATVEYFSFDSYRLKRTMLLPPGLRFDVHPSFTVSRDGQWILFTQLDHSGSDIEMVSDRAR